MVDRAARVLVVCPSMDATYDEFPFVQAIASQPRSWLGEWTAAIEQHGPLILRAHASLVLDVSRQRVHELVEEGKLKVVFVRDVQWITVESIDAFMADLERGGRHLNVERYWLRKITDRQRQVKKHP